jgi:hypothetical protein
MDEKNSAQERYLDAAVDAFMEQYGQIWEETVQEEAEQEKDTEVPQTLDERCKALLQKEGKKALRQQRRNAFLRVSRRVAVALVAFLVTFSVLFVSVEAIRIPIINFFIELRETYLIVSSNKPEPVEEPYNPQDPLCGLVPEGFDLVYAEGTPSNLIADYRDGSGAFVLMTLYTTGGKSYFDIEDAEVRHIKMQGYDTLMILEGDSIMFFWADPSKDAEITVCTWMLDEETALTVAGEFAALVENVPSIFPDDQFLIKSTP